MDLPGLGSFKLDSPLNETEINGIPEGLSFESDPSSRQSPELVNFISSETGKMKALAAADLDSHLQLAHQFLNIGKPFLFDGIGSLSKQRSGGYVFAPGPVLPEVVQKKENPQATEFKDDPSIDYKKIFYGRRIKASGMKAATFVLAAFGMGLAIWGGYTIYKRSANKGPGNGLETAVFEEPVTESSVIFTSTNEGRLDTASTAIVNEAPQTGNKKFVLETANAKRAFSRYQRLKSFQWKVEMETSDSVQYKLFVMIPTDLSDTTRIIDSLTRMNGKRVFME
jgi:hypothetical protein